MVIRNPAEKAIAAANPPSVVVCKPDFIQYSAVQRDLHAPTINQLDSSEWVAIESVVDECAVRDLIPKLKKAGAEGIIELPLNKVIA